MGTVLRLKRSKNTLISEVTRYVVHPLYSYKKFSHDVAVVYLRNAIPLDHPTVRIAPLPLESPQTGSNCLLSGFGRLFNDGPVPEVLYATNLTILSRLTCKKFYFFKEYSSGMLCAGAVDPFKNSRSGDSGGPLLCGNTLTGVTSWGPKLDRHGPGVYTDVFYYKDWIETGEGFTITSGENSFLSAFENVVLTLFLHWFSLFLIED